MCLCWYELKTQSELFWEFWFRKDRIFSNWHEHHRAASSGGRSPSPADPAASWGRLLLMQREKRDACHVAQDRHRSPVGGTRHFPAETPPATKPGAALDPTRPRCTPRAATRAPREPQPLLRPLRSERWSSPPSGSQNSRESKSKTEAAFGGVQPASPRHTHRRPHRTASSLQARQRGGCRSGGRCGRGPGGRGAQGASEGMFSGDSALCGPLIYESPVPTSQGSLAVYLPL